MPLTIDRVDLKQRAVLQSLMNMYLHEMSAFNEMAVDDDGNFEYKHMSCYWVEPERHPFFVRVKGKIAGFVLVRDIDSISGDTIHSIAEFFILNTYRRLGIGEEIARIVLNRFPGKWQIAVQEENRVGRLFWKRVIWRYTGGKSHEFRSGDWDGTVFEFRSPGAKPPEPGPLSE